MKRDHKKVRTIAVAIAIGMMGNRGLGAKRRRLPGRVRRQGRVDGQRRQRGGDDAGGGAVLESGGPRLSRGDRGRRRTGRNQRARELCQSRRQQRTAE